MRRLVLPTLLALAACGRGAPARTSNPTCGIVAIAGAARLLEQFTIPQQTLSQPPARLPERTVARVAAGPAFPALVGRADSGLVIGVEGALPATLAPKFGVLVVQKGGAVQGVMLFETDPIEAAPKLGVVNAGRLTLPLLGIELEMGAVQDPACPLFPDSLRQP